MAGFHFMASPAVSEMVFGTPILAFNFSPSNAHHQTCLFFPFLAFGGWGLLVYLGLECLGVFVFLVFVFFCLVFVFVYFALFDFVIGLFLVLFLFLYLGFLLFLLFGFVFVCSCLNHNIKFWGACIMFSFCCYFLVFVVLF